MSTYIHISLFIGVEKISSPEPALTKDSAFRATFFGIGPGDIKSPTENKGWFTSSQSSNHLFVIVKIIAIFSAKSLLFI